MTNIVIDWVRHAESCTNLLDAKVTDNYNSNNNITNFKGFLREINMEEDKFYKNDSKPFKSDIDSVNEKLELFIEKSDNDVCGSSITDEIIKENCIDENSTDDTCWDATVKACKNSQKAKAAYTKYKMKKSSWLYHPTLSYIGIQQAIALGRDEEFTNILQSQNYKVIITSATARTIMTALLSLQNNNIIDYKNNKIIVMPYINEHENSAGDFGLDRANAALPYDKIDSIIEEIIKWLKLNDSSMHYLTVDTAFYKKKCQDNINSAPYKADIDKFNQILPELLEYCNITTDTQLPINILAYAHGYVILNKFKKYGLNPPDRFLPNVSMYRENSQNPDINKKIERIHSGMRVRSTRGSNNESTDTNLCSLDSLRGDINKMLLGNDTTKKIKQTL